MPAFGSEERQLLHDSVQSFFKSQYPFEHFRELSNPQHADGFDKAAWQQYAELGWLAVALPESAGGSEGGMTEVGIIMAGAGAALCMEPLLATVVLGASAIELAGTPEQQAMLEQIGTGERTLAFCHAEPDGGFARDYVQCVATPSGEGYVLNGQKSFALHAQAADTLVVSARIGDANGPVGLFIVPSNTAGVAIRPAPTLDTRRGAAVNLDDVAVGSDALLGGSNDDRQAVIEQVLDRALVALCAEAAGAMAEVTEQTVEYLKTRQQFGQPLSKFQVLQHRLVDMNIACEEARASTQRALTAIDNGDEDARTIVWRAKVQMAKSARFVGAQAVQLHGGMGMTDDLAIGHYYKRLTLCETMLGDGDYYLKVLS